MEQIAHTNQMREAHEMWQNGDLDDRVCALDKMLSLARNECDLRAALVAAAWATSLSTEFTDDVEASDYFAMAVEMYQAAVDQHSSVPAMLQLARMIPEQWLHYCRLAADHDDSQAVIKVANYYQVKHAVDSDIDRDSIANLDELLRYTRKAAALDDGKSILWLAQWTENEDEHDEQEVVDLFLRGASVGNGQCSRSAGKILYHGSEQVSRDTERAIELLSQAARITDLPNLFQLANTVHEGDESVQMAPDIEHAFDLYHEAAAKGCAQSIEVLGHCYLDGASCEKDETLAMHYLEQAVSLGQHSALPALARCYWKIDQQHAKQLLLEFFGPESTEEDPV